MPTYQAFCGDCLKILPTLPEVDTIITDPVWPNCPPGLLPGADKPYELFNEACHLFRCRRLVVVLRSDSDPRFLSGVPSALPFFRTQILPYVMPGYIGRKLGGDEIAYCFGEPLPSAPGRRVIPGYAPKVQPQGRAANGHPCSRALEHFLWLVKWWSLPGEVVMDPFMGSGTTLVAALLLKRQAIGIEIRDEYFDLALPRIVDAARALDGHPKRIEGKATDYEHCPLFAADWESTAEYAKPKRKGGRKAR